MQALLYRQLGPVEVDARFRVVNTQLVPQHVLPQPNGWNEARQGTWDDTDISRLVIKDQAQVAHDATKIVHRSCTFTAMHPAYLPEYANQTPPDFPYDPLTDFIHVSRVLMCNGITVEVPLGFFWTILNTRQISPGVRYYAFNTMDLTGLIWRTDLLSDWTFNAGRSGGYTGVVQSLLTSAAIPKSLGGRGQTDQGNDDAGPSIPAALLQLGSYGNQDLPVDELIQMGTNRLDAVNQMLDRINFFPLWQRNRPVAGSVVGDLAFVSTQRPEWSNGIPPVTFDYSTLPGTSIVIGPVQQDFGSQVDTDVCNLVKSCVTQTAAGGTDFSSTQMNSDPDSVISTANLLSLDGGPRALVKVETNSQAPNQAMCDLRAKLLLQNGAQLTETIQIQTLDMPLSEDNDLVICQVQDTKGDVFVPSSSTAPFVETAWTMPLAVNTRVTRTLRRVVSV